MSSSPINNLSVKPKIQRRYIRWAAWGVSLVFAYFIFIQWQSFSSKLPARNTTQPATSTKQAPLTTADSLSTPTTNPVAAPAQPEQANDFILSDAQSDKSVNNAPVEADPGRLIRISNDVLELTIDLLGGDIVDAWLLKYPREIDRQESIQLLHRNEKTYIAQGGLVGKHGPDARASRPLYSATGNEFRLQNGQDAVEVVLSYSDNALQMQKTFTLRADDYLIDVKHSAKNLSSQALELRQFGQIRRGDFEPENHASSGFGVQPYVGAALTTKESKYEKLDFDDMRDGNLREEIEGGWIAMIQHYFMSAWIGNASENNIYLTRKVDNNEFIMGFLGPVNRVEPGSNLDFVSRVYIGPKIIKRLEKIAPNINLTVDFGWLWFLASPLFQVLDWLNSYVSNWGVAIILLTLLVKLVFFYPSQMSYRSMARMRKLSPQMQQLRESYASDKQKLQQEMMALYRREKVNPLGGCLPILIQMPVFIALYWMLLESVELRHAPFALWINDLTAIDPYFILPLLMGATMLIQQLLSPAPPDPTQAKIMRLLPVVFTFMFLWFPAGLVLYWVTNNTLSIIQQWVITRTIK